MYNYDASHLRLHEHLMSPLPAVVLARGLQEKLLCELHHALVLHISR